METQKDYYAILGVLPTAEDVVIRAAYKALAQRYHPDRYEGTAEDANRRMADINEAYAVLHDAAKRKEYDIIRGKGTQEGSSFFEEEAAGTPPIFDPLEEDWRIATSYYDDLAGMESRLAKISWRLAYSFRAYLLGERLFEQRREIADELEQRFIQLYFGTNPKIMSFAKDMIEQGNKPAAKALNQAVRVLGGQLEPDRVISKVKRAYPSPQKSESQLMADFGIIYDGEFYRLGPYRYEKLSDAVKYATLCKTKGSS